MIALKPAPTLSPAIRHDVVDNHTGRVVGTAKTRTRAAQSADKRDNAHGAIRYSVRPVYA